MISAKYPSLMTSAPVTATEPGLFICAADFTAAVTKR
jgi:hypothetical protein